MNWKSAPFENRKLHVLVVDSHVSVSELLSMLLDREGRYSVVAEARTGAEGLRLCRKYKPELVISALELPELNGVEMLRTIRKEAVDVKSLVYTGSRNEELIGAAMELEPQGFVHKSESLAVLRQAIAMVAEGLCCFSPYATEHINRKRSKTKGVSNLKPKERVILQLVAEGLSSKEVAQRLSLSPKTIEHYRKGLMQKLDARSVTSLILCAVKLGLVQSLVLCANVTGESF